MVTINSMSTTAKDSAVCYSQISTAHHEVGTKLLTLLSPKKADQILDLGCGTGYLANIAAQSVGLKGRIVAVDPDAERIKLAMSTESYARENLKFAVASDKDFPEGNYDIVFSMSVIHWIEDKESTFRRVYQNLRPGGSFGFTAVNEHVPPEPLDQLVNLFGLQTVEATLGSLHLISSEDYRVLATSVGFEVTLLEVQMLPVSIPNIDFFIDYFYGIFHGKFNRSSPVLDDFKKQYEGWSTDMEVPLLTIILTKPLPKI